MSEDILPHEPLKQNHTVPDERPTPLPLFVESYGGETKGERVLVSVIIFFLTLIFVILATRGLVP